MQELLTAIPQLSWEFVLFLYLLVFTGSFWHIARTTGENKPLFHTLTNPLIYFQMIMFMAFPLRGQMLDWKLIYTQSGATFPDTQILMIASLLALALEVIVIIGFLSLKSNSILQAAANEQRTENQLGLFFKRLLWINLAFIVTISAFYFWTMFKTGKFEWMFGTEQFEARKGNGALYLPTVFIYTYVFCLAAAAIVAWKRVPHKKFLGIPLTFIFVTMPAQLLALVILMSRRDIAVVMALLVMIGAIFAYQKQKRILACVMVFIVMSGTFIASPLLDYARNVIAPTLVGSYSKIEATAGKELVSIAMPTIEMRSVDFLDEIMAKHRVFIVSLSSSFEGVDHAARYLETRTPKQFLTGSDYGKSWLYSVALSYVPRAIWKSKPLIYGNDETQFSLYPQFKAFGYTAPRTPLSFVVDFQYGFGIIGAIILCFLLGRLFAATYQQWRFNPTPISIAIFLYVFLNMFAIIRGGFAIAPNYIFMIIMVCAAFGFKNTLQELSQIACATFGIRKRPA